MKRRKFLRNSFLTGAAAIAGSQSFAESKQATGLKVNKPFNLNYAIHDGMFKNHAGDDFIEQIKFAHSAGFRSIEDNGMMARPADQQKKIGEKQ